MIRLPGAGWRSSILLSVSVKWIAFIVSSFIVAVGVWQGGPFIYVYLVGLFAGLVLLSLWVRHCFEKTLVHLDRDRIVVKRSLFGWSRLKETKLDSTSRAQFVDDDSQNESPEYRIEIRGPDGAAKFGNYLSADELNWLIDRINEFLGVDLDPIKTQQAALRGEILNGSVPRLVTVEEQAPDCLRLRLPTAATVGAKAGGMVIGITLAIILLFAGDHFDWWWPYSVVPATFCLLLSILLIRGHTTIELTPAQMRHVSQIGPWHYTKSIPTEDIIEFDVVLTQERNLRDKLEDLAESDHNCVAILSPKKKRIFLWMAKQHAATYVAETFQQQLNRIRDEF